MIYCISLLFVISLSLSQMQNVELDPLYGDRIKTEIVAAKADYFACPKRYFKASCYQTAVQRMTVLQMLKDEERHVRTEEREVRAEERQVRAEERQVRAEERMINERAHTVQIPGLAVDTNSTASMSIASMYVSLVFAGLFLRCSHSNSPIPLKIIAVYIGMLGVVLTAATGLYPKFSLAAFTLFCLGALLSSPMLLHFVNERRPSVLAVLHQCNEDAAVCVLLVFTAMFLVRIAGVAFGAPWALLFDLPIFLLFIAIASVLKRTVIIDALEGWRTQLLPPRPTAAAGAQPAEARRAAAALAAEAQAAGAAAKPAAAAAPQPAEDAAAQPARHSCDLGRSPSREAG